MPKRPILALTLSGLLAGISLLGGVAVAAAAPDFQTTPTATPSGPTVEAYLDQPTNVRAGPGTEYDLVGVMVKGQSGAILGRSPDGRWIKIVYLGGLDNTGWVYRDLVRVAGVESGGYPNIATIMPPPTPTLPPTPIPAVTQPEGTSTPAEAALSTFTPAPPVVRPTLLPVQGAGQGGGFPPALIIITLFVLGAFGGLVSLLRRRG